MAAARIPTPIKTVQMTIAHVALRVGISNLLSHSSALSGMPGA
jgi:hypothetical protein